MDYAGSTFGKSMKTSFLSGEIMVTLVDTNLLIKFETEEVEKNHIAKLKHWEKKLHG